MSKKGLTDAQRRMLVSLRDHGDFPYVSGLQGNGALEMTRMSLVRKGLIAYDRENGTWSPTPEGIKMLEDA